MPKINLTNTSTDDIYLDVENYNKFITLIKNDLVEINDILKNMKKICVALRDDPKTKGKFKKTVNKLVDGAQKKIVNNNKSKNSLETSMYKSAQEYYEALTAFAELDTMAEDLGNE